jgi:hypothetical protein
MTNSIINYFHLTAEQFEKLTAQQTDILLFILTHGSITPMDAFSVLYITKLATRISEMKAIGIQFDQIYESRRNSEGKSVRFMRYRKAA